MGLGEMYSEDWSVAFADWGVAGVYRVVSQELTVTSGEVVETVTDAAIQVLTGARDQRAVAATAGQAVSGQRELIVRAAALPDGGPRLTDRIVMDGVEYAIREFEKDERSGVVVLRVEG